MAREEESARYRQAAQLALDQLDWCIDYLRSIRKTRIATELAKNRSVMRRRLEAPLSGSVGETGHSSESRQ